MRAGASGEKCRDGACAHPPGGVVQCGIAELLAFGSTPASTSASMAVTSPRSAALRNWSSRSHR